MAVVTQTPRSAHAQDTKLFKSKKRMAIEIGLLATKANSIERNTSRQKMANSDMQAEIDKMKADFERELAKLDRKQSTPQQPIFRSQQLLMNTAAMSAEKLKEQNSALTKENEELNQKETTLKDDLQRVTAKPLRKLIDANL